MQETFERAAVSLDALLESEVADSESQLALADPQADVENTVVNRELVHQMLRDERLSDGERKLLLFQYEYPDATYRNLSSMMGFKHPEQVRRIFKAIASKLGEYNVA